MLAQRGSGEPQSQQKSLPGTESICSIRLKCLDLIGQKPSRKLSLPLAKTVELKLSLNFYLAYIHKQVNC